MAKQIHNHRSLKDLRKKLRNNATAAEAVLWSRLSHSRLHGRKFRRQHSIANYVVDFYCPSERLIVELDGKYHFNTGGMERDVFRDQLLTSLGFTVLRVENKFVFQNIDNVLDEIASHWKGKNQFDI